jgi:inosose dehydratase
MGTDVFIVAETSNAIHGRRDLPLSRRPVMRQEDWAGYGPKITEFAELLAAEGFRLCYHHHMGTIVETEADIHNFMAHTRPPAMLLLDTGHATWGGSDPAGLAQKYRDRIGHVHVKDVRRAVMEQARREDWSFLDSILGKGQDLGVYTVPGDGMVDYPAVFRALPGYSGWVVIEAEQDPEKANPLRYAKLGVANLKRYLTEAGLR